MSEINHFPYATYDEYYHPLFSELFGDPEDYSLSPPPPPPPPHEVHTDVPNSTHTDQPQSLSMTRPPPQSLSM
ncbi:hypothetical protein TIFTF001_033660, partial [Ficus carica]